MPANVLKHYVDKYNVPLEKVETFWKEAKKQYNDDYKRISGTVKKMCLNYNKSKNESRFEHLYSILRG